MQDRPYAGRVAAMATRHGKLELVSPPLGEHLGLLVVQVDVDTDALGTFSGELPRSEGPVETAFRKARLGMEASGRSIGIASEGTIGPDGLVPVTADHEIVAIVDDVHGFCLAEHAIGYETTVHSWLLDAQFPDATDLSRAGYPEHGLIVRRTDDPRATIHKGIHDDDALRRAIATCRPRGTGTVRIESDLRAMHCPSRRPVIARAALALARRLSATCPACGCPGWGVVEVQPGLPCAACGSATRVARSRTAGCPRCNERTTAPSDERAADPATCGLCNP